MITRTCDMCLFSSCSLLVYLVYSCSLIHYCVVSILFFFFNQKTAYDMRISDWSSDVCSSDLIPFSGNRREGVIARRRPSRRRERQTGAPSGRQENGRASCRERVSKYV